MPRGSLGIEDRQTTIPLHIYSRIVVLGVGGIGAWVALDLAMSGSVQHLYLVDPDIVEASNLNRTPFRICDIGNPKVDAMKFMILERRALEVTTYMQKTNKKLSEKIKEEFEIDYVEIDEGDIMIDNCAVIDCRDDVFEDFYDFKCKYYKIGYDGIEVTIDGNPRNTAVWGRANNYTVVPSFICPAQLAANLVVTDILIQDPGYLSGSPSDTIKNNNPFDIRCRFNGVVTFNTRQILEILYRNNLQEGVPDVD